MSQILTLKRTYKITFNVLIFEPLNVNAAATYDFSTLYTTLPPTLIEVKLIDLIERTFQEEGSPYLACNDRNAFFTSEKKNKKISSMVMSKCM